MHCVQYIAPKASLEFLRELGSHVLFFKVSQQIWSKVKNLPPMFSFAAISLTKTDEFGRNSKLHYCTYIEYEYRI